MEDLLLQAPIFSSKKEKEEYINDIFSAKTNFPLTLGGMATGFSNKDLVCAVMDQGGIGVLAGTGIGYKEMQEKLMEKIPFNERPMILAEANAKELLRQIKAVREKNPYGILGVNIMKAVSDYDNLLQTIGKSELVDIIFVGAGLDMALGEKMKNYPHMKYVPIISAFRAGDILMSVAINKGFRIPDAFYIEHPSFAGGHLGAKDVADSQDTAKFARKPNILELKTKYPQVPLLVGGGIMYKEDIKQALNDGANGIVMGTRFLLTKESGLPNNIITSAYLNPEIEIVTTMRSPAGLPSTHLKNNLMEGEEKKEDIIKETKARCASCIGGNRCEFMKGNSPYCFREFLPATTQGKKDGLQFTGKRLGDIRKDELYKNLYVPTVKETVLFVLFGKLPTF